MKKILIVAAMLVFSANVTANTCMPSDLGGTWILYTMIAVGHRQPVAARCTIVIPPSAADNKISGKCSMPSTNKGKFITGYYPLEGALSLSDDCHIRGYILTKIWSNYADMHRVDSFLSKDKYNMSGVLFLDWEPEHSSVFTAIKYD